MPSTYTARSKFEKQAYDENAETWGTKLDVFADKVDFVVNGRAVVDIGGQTSYSLTYLDGSVDEATARVIKFTGTLTADCAVTVPSVEKLTVYDNATSGDFDLTIQTSSGNAITIPQGSRMLLLCDGVDHIDAVTATIGDFDIGGDVGANNLSAASALSIAQGGTGGSTVAEAFANLTKPGMVMIDCTGSIPDGWLLCNGQAISRTIYANLFTAIGTIWGSGDGSTTFNVPNFQGRFPVGGGTWTTLGAYGGASAVTLTIANMPAHSHTGSTIASSGAHTHTTDGESTTHNHAISSASAGNHSHSISNVISSTTSTTAVGALRGTGTQSNPVFVIGGAITDTTGNHTHSPSSGTESALHTHAIQSSGAHTHTVTVASQGSGTSFSILPPFAGVNWIIKT